MDRHQYPGPAETPDRDQGFTLIELLIVIAILGILSTIVVLSVRGITDKGSTSACDADESTLRHAFEVYSAQGTPAFTGSGSFEDFLVTEGFLNSVSSKHDLASDGTITGTGGGGCSSTATTAAPANAPTGIALAAPFQASTFTPANATPPPNLTALRASGLTPTPSFPWANQTWVNLGDGTSASWNGTTWNYTVPTDIVLGAPGELVPASLHAPLDLPTLLAMDFTPALNDPWLPPVYMELLDGTKVTWNGDTWVLWPVA